jgi:hypothetical protein
MDTELRNAYELGSASSETAFGRNEPTQHHPSIPVELCLETHLAHDLAEAYTLKLTDKKRFETARNSGMVEMPSSLAIRAGLLLFKNENETMKHQKFLEDPSHYESSIGKVYCDAGNDIYARIVQEREQAMAQCNPDIAFLRKKSLKADLVEVVLYQYRHMQKPHSAQLMAHLEHVIEGALLEVHGADASSSSNDSFFARVLRCCHHLLTQCWNCCGHRGLESSRR